MAKVQEAAKSAKPGTTDTAAQKAPKPPRAKRVAYTIPEGGLKAVPADFDPKKFKPLNRKAFADEATFFEMKAVKADQLAAHFRKAADDSRKLGSVVDRAKAKKLIAMTERMAELTAELKKQGVDVDALLKKAETESASSKV